MFKQVSRIALVSAFVALAAQPGWALDADDFGAKLKGAVQLLGMAIDYDRAAAEGDTITLSDFTLYVPGEDAVELPGDLVFSGVEEAGDGSYTVTTASIADLEVEDLEEGMSLSFRDVRIEGMTIPARIEAGNLLPAAMGLYSSASAGPLIISKDGTEVFAMDRVISTNEITAGSDDILTSVAVEGIRADLSMVTDPEARKVIAAFGLEQLSAHMSGASVWNPETGSATFEDFVFAVDNLGALTTNGEITGYDRAFYQDIMKINLKLAEMAASGEAIPEAEMAAIEQAMLEKTMAVKLSRLSIRYDDASLFMKILDYVGAEQGIDGQAFASGLKFMVPMMLLEVPDAEFRATVTREVNAFIDDPQNFEVSAQPDAPVGVEQLAIAEDDPFALIDLLKVKITANQ